MFIKTQHKKRLQINTTLNTAHTHEELHLVTSYWFLGFILIYREYKLLSDNI